MIPIPPVASKRPHSITQHGQTRIDDYFWLRNRDDPETLPYLKAENEYLEAVLAHTLPLQEKLFLEMKARIPESDLSAPQKHGGYIYYTRMEPGRQYPIYYRKTGMDESEEEVLLDQNVLAEGHPFCGLGAFELSPDHAKLAYLVDYEGSEIYTLYIKDLCTGRLFPEAIPNTYGLFYYQRGVAWSLDNQTLFYTTLDTAHRPYRLYRHVVGTSPDQDVLVYEEEDPLFSMFIHASRTKAYLFIELSTTSSHEIRCLPLSQPAASLEIIAARQPFIEYSIDHQGKRFLIRTNDSAQNFRLMEAPISSPCRENWREILPGRDDVTLETVYAFQDELVLIERKDGLRQIRLSAPDGISKVRYIPMPEASYSITYEHNPEFAGRIFRFGYSSLITPDSVIDYDMSNGSWVTVKQRVIPSGYDPSQYETERLFANAPDGKQVPISLVYRKGRERIGKNPLLLNGYGSYGFSQDPNFSSNRLSLLDRGFIFAIAHVRGGSDLGRSWYEDGKLLKKKNTFTDFIVCAEHLIANGYTCREKLAISGASAGGLLVGAVMTMRPDLCKAVVAQVPFVDVVNTMNDPSIPLTTREYDQWGNPDDHIFFDYLMSYSPYDNLKPLEYPDILLTTSLNDPRVAFWEPVKFTARLRDIKATDSLVLLKTDFGAGHGGASGRYNALKDFALIYAFLIERLGDYKDQEQIL
jgi:oligopeptidase B